MLHNGNGANFELARTPARPTPRSDWQPLIAHDPAVRLEDVDAFAGHLVVHQRSDGLTQLRILELGDDGRRRRLPRRVRRRGLHRRLGRQPGVRAADGPLRLHDAGHARRRPRLRRPHPRDHAAQADPGPRLRPPAYEQHRTWATAPDGTRVPISIVVPAGAPRDGSVPFLLYGYGAYETSIDPYFSIARLSLLDRGAGFAIAHVRGRRRDGPALVRRRQARATSSNTFTDFAACARHLVDEGWTSADRLVAEGGSAGGLLIGAVANQAPELFAGFVAQVPFVDPLTTMLDAVAAADRHRVRRVGQPRGRPRGVPHDPRATRRTTTWPTSTTRRSWPSARSTTPGCSTSRRPSGWPGCGPRSTGRRDFLLKTEMSAGHGGVSGRYKAWRDRAFTAAWILDRMGLS